MVERRRVRRQSKGDEMINRAKPWNGTDGVRNMMWARHQRMAANSRSGNAGLKGEPIKLLLKA